MRGKILMLTFAVMVGFALGAISYRVLSAQQAPPTKNKGVKLKTVALLELGPQIPEFQGRYLRARVVTIEPGGHGAVHSHKDLPAIFYILQGTLTHCTPDGKCTVLHEGQAKAEGKDVAHWSENRGTTPLTYLAVSIRREP